MVPHLTSFRARLIKIGNKLIGKTHEKDSQVHGDIAAPHSTCSCCIEQLAPETLYKNRPCCPRRTSTDETPDDIQLRQVDRAWFQRRNSSLKRLSAKIMPFKEDIHFARKTTSAAHAPLVLDVDEDFFSPILTMELMSLTSLNHNKGKAVEENADKSRPSVVSFFSRHSSGCHSPAVSKDYGLIRSPPMNIRKQQAEGFCVLSETPFEGADFRGMYGETPDSARTCRDIAFYRRRQQSSSSYISYRTARSSVTSFIKFWRP